MKIKEDVVAANLSSLREAVILLPTNIKTELDALTPKSIAIDASQLSTTIEGAVESALQKVKSDDNEIIAKYNDMSGKALKVNKELMDLKGKDEKSYSETLTSINQNLSGIKTEMERIRSNEPAPPEPPKVWYGWPWFVLLRVPWWLVRVLWCQAWFKNFVILCMTAAVAVSHIQTKRIAAENAQLKNNEEKAELIHNVCRLNKDLREKIDYIDALYKDKPAHNDEIGALWRECFRKQQEKELGRNPFRKW